MLINPAAAKKRSMVGTRDKPTNESTSLVRNRVANGLVRLSTKSFTTLRQTRYTSSITSMTTMLMTPKMAMLLPIGASALNWVRCTSVLVSNRIRMTARTMMTASRNRFFRS